MNAYNVNYISEQDYININKRSKVDVGDVLFAGSIGRTDFPRGNHADLIHAINLLKEPAYRNELGVAGKQFIKHKSYFWENYETLYHQLIFG